MTWRLIIAGAAAGLLLATAVGGAVAEKRQPNFAAGLRALAAEDFAGAVQQLERAIVADPKNSNAYYHLGRSHRGLGDSDRALKYLRLALQIDPNHFAALRERGETLLAQGKRKEARGILDELSNRCGDSCPDAAALRDAIRAAGE